MTTNKIDLEAHKALTKKHRLRFYGSLFWRQILFLALPVLIFNLFFIFPKISPGMQLSKILPLTAVSFLVGLGVFLVTSQYILNSLVHIPYKDFRVCAVKDNEILDEMGFYDSLCWWGSYFWRQIIVSLVFILISSVIIGVITATITYFIIKFAYPHDVLIPILNFFFLISYGVGFIANMLAFFWLLKAKKKGRLLLLQPLQDGPRQSDKAVTA